MEIKIKPKHIGGIIVGFLIIIFNLYLRFEIFKAPNRFFMPIFVIAFVAMGLMFFLDFLDENKRQKDLELKFLEFVRALVETVRGGIPIPTAIVQISNENYGSLTPYVKKLAHQIEWGYTLHHALNIFSKDTNNSVIKKSIAIVIQAEKSGGDMGTVLQEITKSVVEVKKIKEERRSNAYTQIVQGYLIFFIFIAIMLILEKILLPKLNAIGLDISNVGGIPGLSGMSGSGAKMDPKEFEKIFIGLILVQGFFAGLMIGKFAEGNLKSGLKHSAIMMILGYIIIITVIGVNNTETEVVVPALLFFGNFINDRLKNIKNYIK